jgi:hypothetical protein
MNQVEELLARDEIRRLACRYALAVDGKDLDGLAELFPPDVVNGRYGPGRDGVKTFYDHVLREFHCSMHLVGNHVIDFDDDRRAHGIVYCRAHHHVLDPEHWFDQALAYWDTYELVGEEWLFRRRSLKSWYREEVGHPTVPNAREVMHPEETGPLRGPQMPEAFPTFDAFWSGPPRPLPDH